MLISWLGKAYLLRCCSELHLQSTKKKALIAVAKEEHLLPTLRYKAPNVILIYR